MGRKPEFKATKSFTMGLRELAWLKEYSERRNEKASAIVNKLIRTAMLEDDHEEKERKLRGPIAYCTGCSKQREFEPVQHDKQGNYSPNIHWLCFECGEDKTEVIEYHIKRTLQQ
jgi:hypothetical protein